MRNYLLVALRRLRRDKIHSFINIASLAIGLTIVLLIGLWILDECTFDRYNPHYDHIARLMQFETTNGNTAAIRTAFLHILPDAVFDYRFVDEQFARKFLNETRIGTLAAFFAGFALFISALGIFGMASFTAEQRIREIGVRRILGATVLGIWRMLTGEFILLVGLSLLIAAPLASLIMHRWLQNYTFHTHLTWEIFAGTASGTLAITLLTVSWTAIRAALTNPINALRNE